ncbi:hypothetical protein ACIQM0_32570 [Streptomyces sp. NPDC091387]|uniref:hypothetical protein n=1 Tax=Streptomyces sp. NPDC091387 TaxID=3365998 RepID=UPI003825F4C9
MERPRRIIACGDFVLRCLREQSDVAPACTLIEESLEHLRPWEPWVARHSEKSTRDFLAKSEPNWASGDVYNYAIEIAHDLYNTSSAAVPRRLGFTEVLREQATRPAAPAGSGIDVVWRLHRPTPPVDGPPCP